MSQIIQAVYENGLLRPLAPLDLPENVMVEIDVRDVVEHEEETAREKTRRVLRSAGISSELNFPITERLSDEERLRIGKLFSAGKPLSELIDEERNERG